MQVKSVSRNKIEMRHHQSAYFNVLHIVLSIGNGDVCIFPVKYTEQCKCVVGRTMFVQVLAMNILARRNLWLIQFEWYCD